MKAILTILLLCLNASLLFSQELTFATFNCEFLNKKKIHVKYGVKFSLNDTTVSEKAFWEDDTNKQQKLEEATLEVANQIKLINADVIGLTEVGNITDVTLLQATLELIGLTYEFMEVCKSKDVSTGQHVAFLSKIRLKNVEDFFPGRGLYFTESDRDETSETGISKAMKATVKFEGHNIHVFLIHLKSERGSYESDQQRIKQAEIIREMVIPLLDNNEHIIVMGDLNSERRHETLLTLRGFNDLGQELIQTGDSDYFKDFSTRWTYEFMGSREQIDHILLSIPLRKLCFANNRSTGRFGVETTILETNNDKISDHNAVIVKLLFK